MSKLLRKAVTVSMMILLICLTNVYAAHNMTAAVSFEPATLTVTLLGEITGEGSCPDILVYVYEDDEDNMFSYDKNIIGMIQVTPSFADGKYVLSDIKIPLPSDLKADEYYNVYLAGVDINVTNTIMPVKLFYPGEKAIKESIKEINVAANNASDSETPEETFKAALDSQKSILNLNYSTYYDEEDLSKEAFRIMINIINTRDMVSIEDVQNTIDDSMNVARINLSFDTDAEDAIKKLNPDLLEDYNSDEEIKSDILDALKNYGKFDTTDEFYEMFEDKTVTTVVNNVAVDDIEDILYKYKDILKKYDDGFISALDEDYQSGNKTYVNKYVARTDFSSVEEIVSVFMSAVESIDNTANTKPNNNSGNGGSGGGRGSGSKSPISSMNVINSDKTNDNEAVSEKEFLFKDIASVPWAYEAIESLTEKGVINGVSENEFAPNRYVTREEFVKMVVVAYSIDGGDIAAAYNDVSRDRWSYPYIAAASSTGIIKGTEDFNFAPMENITRQDMAVIISRIYDYMKISAGESKSVIEFADFDEVADYAKDAVKILSAQGIIQGNSEGRFLPEDYCMRAEAAVVIHRLLQQIGDV